MCYLVLTSIVFFFNDTATTEIYTLSLHDALPIWTGRVGLVPGTVRRQGRDLRGARHRPVPGSSHRSGRGRRLRPEDRSEEHTSELQSQSNIVCRLLLEKKKDSI